MYENSQSRNHGKNKGRRRQLAEKATIETNDLLGENDVEPTKLSGFRYYQKCVSGYNELNLYDKVKRHRYKGSSTNERMCTDSNFRCEGSTGNLINYQYNLFKTEVIEAEPSISSRLRGVCKCQPEIKDHAIDRKNGNKMENAHINLRKVAEEKFTRQYFKSSSMTPGIISRSSTNNIKSIDSDFSFSHFLQTPIIRNKNDKKPKPMCVRKRLNKIHHELRSTNGITELVQSSSITQPSYDESVSFLTERLSLPKVHKSPFAKTELVYNVYGETPISKRKPGVNLASNASFNVKFYKSMGDGRQMFGNGCPCPQIPRNYSPTNMARAGRDEDGCICVYIPQEQVFDSMQSKNATGDSFLKRYFRVLLKEQARCVCAIKRPKQSPYPYGNGRFNQFGGGMPDYNVGCQCRYDLRNPRRSFRANDAAIQCKCKEKRELRSDDLFCRDRGTTCCVPTCPQKDNENNSKANDKIPNALNQPNEQATRDKNAVNIGSKFSFQVGLYKRCIDTKPKDPPSDPKSNGYYAVNVPYDPYVPYMGSGGLGGDDCNCCGSDDYGYREPKSASILSVLLRSSAPRVQCRSSSVNNAGRDNISCSYLSSSQDPSRCIDGPSPSCCMSRSPSCWDSFKKQFERSDLCCNNQPKSRCKPKKHKAVRCRCDKKPALVGCTDKKSVGVCSTSNLGNSAKDISCNCYTNQGRNIGCNCSNEPTVVLHPCTKKKKTCCSNCNTQESKKTSKTIGTCCSPCKTSKKGNKVAGACCRCKKPKKQRKKGECCCCDEKTSSPSLLEILFKKDEKEEERCCCCNKEPKLNKVGEIFSKFFQKKEPICDKCNVAKKPNCKCTCSKSGNSSEFDYKKVLNNIKLTSQLKKQGGDIRRCACGDINVKKVLSSLLEPTEQKLTKAQQCGCGKGDFDFKKTFGRLLLYNTIQKPICSTCVSNDQNSRSVGAGEEDYRKVPPCRLYPDATQGDATTMNRFMSKLIKPETCCTRMHYSAFNPFNQAEAGIQHSGRIRPDDTAGAVVCRNQGSCVPKPKPMTLKDCENANSALQSDHNRRAVRIGSTCSFSLEIYKGMPPSKTCPPPCPPTCAKPCPGPCADTTATNATVCPPVRQPCRETTPVIKQAIKYMLKPPSTQLAKKKPTCQKCNKCAKVPAIKRGFAAVLLRDKKPLKAAGTCQKTNTLQPNRKVVTRKQTSGKGRLGGPTKCDPYVCLKRINERKCCR